MHDRLVVVDGPPEQVAWAQNVWFDPVSISIESIADAARRLRTIQRNWVLYPIRLHRRASLIQAKLPHVSAKPIVFPAAAPTAPLGSWTLLDEHTILAAARCSSPFAHGEALFVEDKQGPPNRAYLKLWEILTILGERPGPGARCIDLGASPGGWTWAIARLGAGVIAVDKAPLDPKVAALAGVEQRQTSAFGLAPSTIGPVDWVFSDVVCYPKRLLGLVQRWVGSGLARRMVCTIKFQGEPDLAILDAFRSIAGAELRHLFHNKNELTWSWRRNPPAAGD